MGPAPPGFPYVLYFLSLRQRFASRPVRVPGEQTAVELQDWLLLRGGGWPVLVIALIAEDIWVVQAMLLINGVNGINLTPLAALRVDLSTVVTLLAGLALQS